MIYSEELKRTEPRIKESKLKSNHAKRKRNKHRVGDPPFASNPPSSVRTKRGDLELRSPSESSSPVKHVPQPSMIFQPIPMQNFVSTPERSAQDGYEGSEEESFEDSGLTSAESWKLEERAAQGVVPVMYFMFSEPHTFLRCTKASQKLEMSCFDITVKGAPDRAVIPVNECKFLPSPSDYTTPWIETKPGEANVKTGIPPAFLTLTIIDFLVRSADVKLKVRRPLKVEVSLTKYEQACDYVDAIMSSLRKEAGVPGNVSRSQETQQTVDAFEDLRNYLKRIHRVRFSTVQLAIVLKTIPHKENAHLVASLSEASGNLEFKTDKDGLVNEVSTKVTLESYVIKTSYYNKLRSLVGPSTTDINVSVIWETWFPSSSFSVFCCNVDTEALLIQLGRDHLSSLTKLSEHLQDFLPIKSKLDSAAPTPKVEKTASRIKFNETEQYWHDDLRTGTFQYIQDSDDVGIDPGPYEIVFCREQAGQAASMIWCYPQPRALTRAEIYPVPFRTASDTGGQVNLDNREQVNCVLQYWDELLHSFVTYQYFQLSETQHVILDLPHISSETKEVVVAHKWRVILGYCEDEDEELEETVIRRSLVSPLALAACMRVDSYFNPHLVPNVRSRVAFGLIEFTLYNHFQHLGKATPAILQPFVFDGIIPYDQEYLTFILQSFSATASQWRNSTMIDLNGTIKVDIVEFRNLTMQPLIDPFQVYSKLHKTDTDQKPVVVEASVLMDPFFVKVGQNSVHTLNMALQCWNQPSGRSGDQVVMNYYVICNDTQETIRFGQVDMDESIVLHSRQMHAYSWRSHKTKQLLHVCVEGMRWKWCEPFSIDKVGTEIKTMEQKGVRATLIIKVKQLNSVQKQVIICGQLVLSNRLNQHLEAKFVGTGHSENEILNVDQRVVVGQQITAASSIVEPGMIKAMCIRFMGINTGWSTEILFPNGAIQDTKLVQVPLKEKGQFINVWCHFFTQQVGSSWQQLVLFSPLYVIRTHLPQNLNVIVSTPSLDQSYTFPVEGQGLEYQIHCPGGSDVTHQLSFQMGENVEASKPTLPLSVNMITQVTKLEHPPNVDIDYLCKTPTSECSILWPYDDDELKQLLASLPPFISDCIKKEHLKKARPALAAQQNIELQVCLVQRWMCCNTLLIDVKPWGLLINKCPVDVIIQSDSAEELVVPPGETVPSSKLQGSLKVGIIYDERSFFSEPLKLTDEDWSHRRNWPQVHSILPRKGSIKCHVTISSEDTQTLQCCLTIDTKERRGIRILAIQPTFNIINIDNKGFKIGACCIPKGSEKVEYSPENLPVVKIPRSDNEISLHPILFWGTISPDVTCSVASSDTIKYVSLCHCEGHVIDNWSLPSRLHLKMPNSRQAIAVPLDGAMEEMTVGTIPYIISAHEFNNVVYLAVSEDKYPQLILYNKCDIPLHFGQGAKRVVEEFVTQEECELIYHLPVVKAQAASHYTFPSLSANFPKVRERKEDYKLHLAKAVDLSSSSEYMDSVTWSCGVDVAARSDLFLNVPGYSDVKIHIEKVGCTMHVKIDPVSRVEVSAKEIRSRIRIKDETLTSGKLQIKKKVVSKALSVATAPGSPLSTSASETSVVDTGLVESVSPVAHSETSALILGEKQKSSVCSKTESASAKPEKQNFLMYLSMLLKHACLVVTNETSNVESSTELIRLSLDYSTLVVRPTADRGPKKQTTSLYGQEVILCVGNFQVDNQMCGKGNFDYPVVLAQQKDYNPPSLSCKPSMELLLQAVRKDCALVVEILLERDAIVDVTYVQNIAVALKPLRLQVEDTFAYKLLEVLASYIPSFHLNPKDIMSNATNTRVPKTVDTLVTMFHSPIQVQNLVVRPLEVLLSFHASMKIYISLNQTPLTFSSFERRNVLTSPYDLGHVVTMHYLSGALFRAGWVLGSLDIIGNPGGFARAVGSGMSDFVLLPYQGLVRGPWAFIAGVAHGSTSLVRQITAGTLLSVTNMASSVSRNMELLSLDEEYRQQNEETRRNKPVSFTHGLAQGLTGFGISVLGAIAGIVDQPLQSIQHVVEHQNFPASAAVTGLISGVGKGLVGIVTKPLGGAAEFLSQAGHGILHGTGWNKMLHPRYKPSDFSTQSSINSRLKYVWKMLSALPLVEVLFVLDATQVNHNGHYIATVLLLTSQVLFLVHTEEDTQQQAFPLAELDCHSCSSDPTLIMLMPRKAKDPQAAQPEEESQDRVNDFVTKAAKYVSMQEREDSESRSDSSSRLSPIEYSTMESSMQFYVNPQLRNTFLTYFVTAQKNVVGKGFPL